MRIPTRAINNITLLSLASAILKVRKMPDVVEKAVNITKDKKTLNQKRKALAKLNATLDSIVSDADTVFGGLVLEDLKRIQDKTSMQLIQKIPEKTTSPETLALNILYILFNDEVDKVLYAPLKKFTEYDFMDLIITVSEDIGLEKNVSEDMYPLAKKLIMEIK